MPFTTGLVAGHTDHLSNCHIYTYLVVITRIGATYGAFFPDLPGCVATATSRDLLETRLRNALVTHLEGILEDAEEPPTPTTTVFEEIPSAGTVIEGQELISVRATCP